MFFCFLSLSSSRPGSPPPCFKPQVPSDRRKRNLYATRETVEHSFDVFLLSFGMKSEESYCDGGATTTTFSDNEKEEPLLFSHE